MNALGIASRMRFERVGEPGDLEAAISVLRSAVELTPDGHPEKPYRMNNLVCALLRRFERIGDLGDLEASITVQRRAVELTPDGHPDKPAQMYNLGSTLQRRFERRVGELADLEAAISVNRNSVELTPDGHPRKPGRMNNLGNALQSRFQRVGELDDLEAAISVQRRAVELTPDGHSDKPGGMNNLGSALQSRYRRVGELVDLEAAIAVQCRAVDLMPDGHADKPMCMNNLGVSLQTRFERVGELADLEAAISVQRHAVDLTPDGDPHKPLRLRNLGLSFCSLHNHSSTFSHLETAYKCFMDAVIQSSGSPFARFEAAINCVNMFAEKHGFVSAEMLLQAHSHVVRLLPERVWLGHSISRRYEESSKLAHRINDAVAAAIEHGALSQAVAWLEEGRSLVWSQILALRSPLGDLETQHPELTQRLRIIQQQLLHSGHVPRSLELVDQRETTGFAPNAALDSHRGLTIEYNRLLSQVRNCSGFENFLRPKPFSALIPSTALGDGYVVFINVHRTHCDALILTPGGLITSVALPDLSLKRANQLQLLWVEHLKSRRIRMRASDSIEIRHSSLMPLDNGSSDHLLAHTWNWIVEPILKALELTNSIPSGSLPHITWCPTGPLTRIPLHAAGIYSDPKGPRVFNYVVSSYTPSLSALLRSSQGIANRDVAPSVLIVTQPATPGQPALPGTVDEYQRLERLLEDAHIEREILNREEATTTAIRGAIDKHAWVHLACHGSQHTADATLSAFHLYDGRLSLSDLMQTTADDAQLAFLSACQTATGDEKNPEESVHLAAGMLAVGFKGVVATMWSIGDTDAPILVEAYYKKLLELRRTGVVGKGQTGAAYALHEAVKVLRDHVGEKNFLSWAPFVHFGA
ncbi:hypothetical protein PENSPDRAFT_595676 [Peniophora sp. CONT]|nr:hypothetical protein PENSPDRAFT_595676 [Peniophora sp. CONT]